MSRGIGRGRLARCCIKAKQPIGLKAPNYLATEKEDTHRNVKAEGNYLIAINTCFRH